MNKCRLLMLLSSLAIAFLVLPENQAVEAQTNSNAAQFEGVRSVDSPLISADELHAIIADPDVRVLEIGSSRKAFDDGHLPAAQYVDWLTDITDPEKPDRYNIADSATIEKLLSRLGVQNNTRIILYDRLASRLSTRMYWTLKTYGHERIQILNGGFNVWVKNYKVTKDFLKVNETVYKIQTQNKKIATGLDFIQQHLNNPKLKLVDGRPVKQFTGEEPGRVFHTGKEHKKRGHIPGAESVFWQENFDADGKFKSKKELQAIYAARGINPSQCVVTYCNEGLHAAPPWFVLREILGYEDVRLYDDSMSEWGNSDQATEMSKP